MATIESTLKLAPAYVTFSAFLAFLDRLSEGLPDKIDRSIMRTMSGGTQAHLLSSLKFLGLIEEDCSVTGGLKSLVDSRQGGVDAFKAAMRDMASAAYASVFGDVDIQRMTPRQFADKFREAGAEGSTLVKAIRFYLSLLDECGISYPKHLTQAAGSASPNGKKTEPRRPKADRPAEEQQDSPVVEDKPRESDQGVKHSQSQIRIPIPTDGNPHRAATVPFDLIEADCTYLAIMIDAIAKRLAASRQ